MSKHRANDDRDDSARSEKYVTKGRITIPDKLIGLQLLEFRKECKLSQTDIGKMIGVTYQQVQKIETGENRIAASKLLLISVKSGKSMEYFVKKARAYLENT